MSKFPEENGREETLSGFQKNLEAGRGEKSDQPGVFLAPPLLVGREVFTRVEGCSEAREIPHLVGKEAQVGEGGLNNLRNIYSEG